MKNSIVQENGVCNILQAELSYSIYNLSSLFQGKNCIFSQEAKSVTVLSVYSEYDIRGFVAI